MKIRGAFVTGTDTDVGKTFACAWLALGFAAEYWKPVQTGTAPDSGYAVDAPEVARLAPGTVTHPSACHFPAPLSPHEAAEREGRRIELSAIRLPRPRRPGAALIVEGAGGALVPLNEKALTTDLMAALGLPVIVVARSGLGTINHTLLTLEALRARGLRVLGVIMNGEPNQANAAAVAHYGRTAVLAELPRLRTVSAEGIAALPRPAFAIPETEVLQ
ncbi:Dethiobiotin synthetase [Desulfovibrio sp. X2]|uniref:dethiobiotin synthase n=1 Tax=Desulfovibrio sp. X2 TaxID=941449 RepID=UPI000358CE34|nr:dethiobiotin synthase [Desulfovibrio sp. X2]EPR41692.1 Dethiobiotin synthetase [Desulfovibrio sp. X2]